MEHYVLPRTIAAMVLTGTSNQHEIRHDIETPTKPGYQEVICKVMVIAICGTDPKLLKGKPYHYCPEEYPFVIGHEWPGIVVKVGLGMFNLKVGNQVAGEAYRGCGVRKNCKEGCYFLCLNYGNDSTGHRHYGFIAYGVYCQYVRYSRGSPTPLSDNISFEETAMCDTAGVTLHGLERAGVTPGGTVCVIGPGPIGLMSMKIVRRPGVTHAIAVGRGVRLEAAVAIGACDPDKAIDFEACERDGVDVVQKVAEMTGGIGPDNVYEASGAKGAMAQAIEMRKKGGSIALLGTPPKGTMVEIPMKKITFKELALFGSRDNPNVAPAVVNLMATGQLRARDPIAYTFPLTQFRQGIDTLINRKGGAVKVIFYPNEQPEVPFAKA